MNSGNSNPRSADIVIRRWCNGCFDRISPRNVSRKIA